MNNYTNPYVRLQTYYSWLSCRSSAGSHAGISISELQEATQIPIDVIRKDMVSLLKWNAAIAAKYNESMEDALETIENRIYFNVNCLLDPSEIDLDEDDADETVLQLSETENLIISLENGIWSETLEQKIYNGDLDDLPLCISNSCYSEFDVALTYDESQALDAVLKDLSPEHDAAPGHSMLFQIKDNYRAIHNYREMAEKLQMVEDAIQEQTPLCIKYRTKHGIATFHFQPLKISYDESENLYCILSTYQGMIQVYRLDRICSMWPSSETVEHGDVSVIEQLAPQVWGNCFTDPPEHVKVRFYNEANVWEKVRRDLACRTKCQLYEKDGFLYYEDTVYGISKFRPWIYGFGSSAIVLEPVSLREHIIQSLKERKNR